MKKKKINTILILAVTLIWAVVLYKFITPFFAKKEIVLTANTLVIKPQSITKKKDTVDLVFSQRDPFLGTMVQTKKKAVNKTINKTKSKPTKKQVLWPKIEYLGFVKSKNSNSRLGLVRIDSKLHKVNDNSVIRDLKIKKVDKDQITIILNKEVRSFKKR